MPKTIHTATDPNGVVHTRTSQNRTYLFTVVAKPSYAYALTRAGKIEKSDADHFDYMTLVANGHDPYPVKNYSTPGRVVVAGSAPLTQADFDARQINVDAENAARVADAQAEIAFHTAKSFQQARRIARIIAVDHRKTDGYYDTWQNVGWCGRLDLARKLMAATQAKSYWAEVVVLGAEVQGKKAA